MFNTLTRMGASGAGGTYEIDRSLRLYAADSAHLTRAFDEAGNRKTFTLSGWYKFPTNSGQQFLWMVGADGNNQFALVKESVQQFNFECMHSGSQVARFYTSNTLRDQTAWYHFVLAIDTTQGTDTNRMKFYINGIEATMGGQSVATAYPAQDLDFLWGENSVTHYMGKRSYSVNSNDPSDLYMTENYYIDGSALTPSSFGEEDSVTGEWIPKKYSGSYGNAGYYLNFSDNSNTTAGTLGADTSGNGNNWTPNNFSVASGGGNDSVTDTPTNNYCTWSPDDKHRDHISIADGALVPTQTDSGGFAGIKGTMGVTSGKWYFEFTAGGGSGHQIGWVNSEFNMYDAADVAITTAGTNGHGAVFDARGFMYGWIGSEAAAWYPDSSSTTTWTNNDVIGCAMDLDNYKFYFSKNGTFINSQNPVDGTNAIVPTGSNNDGDGAYVAGDIMQPYFTGWGNGTGETNFGQQGFTHTPPTGYKALCSQNLPEPTIKDPADYYKGKIYSGTGSTQTITTGVDADLVWVKRRDDDGYNILANTVSGHSNYLVSNNSDAESVGGGSQIINGFNSTGFQVGTENAVNNSSGTYVSWNWKESASSGFDIVTYTGNGQDDTDVAISHNLGVSPEFVIVKNRDGGNRWQTWHQNLGSGKNIQLQQGDAESVMSSYIKAVSSSNFTVRDDNADGNANVNKNGDDYFAFVFAGVPGFSKFGYYEGNGNANGPYIYLGFKPAYFLYRNIDRSDSWIQSDIVTKPQTDESVKELYANNQNPQNTNTDRKMAYTANGIKILGSEGSINNDNATFIYAAFAESPFKYTTGFVN